jgi:hypothetical protein
MDWAQGSIDMVLAIPSDTLKVRTPLLHSQQVSMRPAHVMCGHASGKCRSYIKLFDLLGYYVLETAVAFKYPYLDFSDKYTQKLGL